MVQASLIGLMERSMRSSRERIAALEVRIARMERSQASPGPAAAVSTPTQQQKVERQTSDLQHSAGVLNLYCVSHELARHRFLEERTHTLALLTLCTRGEVALGTCRNSQHPGVCSCSSTL